MLHYNIAVNVISVFTIIFLATQVYSQTCGKSKRNKIGEDGIRRNKIGEIVNATEGEFPWIVSVLERDNSNNFIVLGSGFLIDRIHVVAPAQSFDTPEPKLYFVRIGSVHLREGEQFSVSKIAIPASYRPGFYYHDIAILTLSREVEIPTFVPVCLPDEKITRMDFSGMLLTLVGWNGNRHSKNFSLNLLELRDLIVFNNEACNEMYEDIASSFRNEFRKGISTEMMCAGFLHKTDICVLQGGALMFKDRNRWFAVGMVSFGTGCGGVVLPDGFTKVSSYLEWIRKNTRD